MREDRRRLLRSLGSGLLASACPSFLSGVLAAGRTAPAALLVPLTGADGAIGRSMARAAALAQADPKALVVIDSGDTPASAAAATRAALKRGVALMLGPLRSGQVRAVVAVAGQVPVLTFSNDVALLDSGAFLLGITPDQSVAPLLHYARGRGIRRIAVVGDGAWRTAAARAGQREGLAIEAVSAEAAAALPGSADPPHALLCAGAPTIAAAVLRDAGIQALVAFSGLDPAPQSLAALEGAWLSAPDPAAFADFATAYEGANGAPPGILAGLARDAASVAATLARSGGSDRPALLAAPRFEGVCGDVRFRADGSASRDMAVLTVAGGRYQVVDHSGTA